MSIFFRGFRPTGFLLLLFIGFVIWCFLEFPALEGSISSPEVVGLDETFSMVITATNTTEKKITLDSIDFEDSFLEGFEVVATQPKPKDTLSILGIRSWEFGTSVGPGESVDVEFTLKAVELGHFYGDVDICNPNQDFFTLIADVEVREEPSGVDGEEVEEETL